MEEVTVEVLRQIPKRGCNKFELDSQKKMIRFDRMLFSALHYPRDYGFIPET